RDPEVRRRAVHPGGPHRAPLDHQSAGCQGRGRERRHPRRGGDRERGGGRSGRPRRGPARGARDARAHLAGDAAGSSALAVRGHVRLWWRLRRMKAKRPLPSTVVLLVRHGLTSTTGVKLPGRAAGLHLSEEGRKQAESAAARIAKIEKVVAIYSSPLERARETAAIIAKARHQAVRIERGLLELNIGKFTGMALKDAHKTEEWKAIQ